MTLCAALADVARRRPGAPALGEEGERLRYGELWDRVERRARNFDKSSRVLVLERPEPIAFLVDFFAARLLERPAVVHAGTAPPLLRKRREDLLAGSALRPEDTVFHSSGSVGPGKAIPLADGALLFAALVFPAGAGLEPRDRVAIGVPAQHIFGFVRGALNTLLIGAEALFFSPRRDPIGEAGSLGGSVALLSAGQVALSALHPGRTSLRAVLTGGASLLERSARAVEQQRGATLRVGYGLTETCGLGARQRLDRPRRPGTAGPAVPGLRVEVLDDHGAPVSSGETGEIHISGPSVFAAYLDPAEQSPFDGEGRFRTGDLGLFDEEGELIVRGRRSAGVQSHGRWLCAEELEAAARECPGVSQAAAVPLANSFALLLEAERPSDAFLKEVRGHLARRVPAFARPRRVLVVPEIPKGAAGKVDRQAALRWLGRS